jgi:transmembrane sensor
MSATLPPIDRAALAGLQGGDEGSLERIFRDQFSALVEEARAELGEAAAASRIVERVFLHVWEERAKFETPEALATFLHRSVHDGAVRERSRRAAVHRFEAFEGVRPQSGARAATAASVDEAWAHVAAALHAPAQNHEAAAHARADLSRHAAAEHAAALGEQRSWVPVIVGGVVALAAIAGAFWWLDRVGTESAITRALDAPETRALSSRAGQRATTTLGDGSQVTLGADSRLVLPERFGTEMRAVKLEGAAAFTVAGAAEQPFHVRAGNAAITATGTKFDVRAYPAEPAVTVRVREGQVTVRAGDESQTLSAGSALVLAKDGSTRQPSAAELEEAVGWADGRLAFAGRPLREVLPEFKRWFGMNLTVSDSALLARRVTMNAGIDASGDAIAALESSAGLKFGYKGKDMILRDTADAEAKAAEKAPTKAEKPR